MDIKSIVITAVFSLMVSFMGVFFNRLWDAMWEPFGYLFNIEQNMKDLKDAAKDLKARADDVKVKIAEAELKQQTSTNEVKVWLHSVRHIPDDVADIEVEKTDYETSSASSLEMFRMRYKVGEKVAEKLKEVKELLAKGAFSTVATALPPDQVEDMISTPRVRAMGSNLDKVIPHLVDTGGVRVIGIWGMGGVGKTTLLKQVNNYFAHKMPPGFASVIFIEVSQIFNLEDVQKNIAKKLGLNPGEYADLSSRAKAINKFLKDKTLLLLLDDLRERVELNHLGIPVEQDGCKVVFTTRSFDVCGSMEANMKIRVKCLGKKEAFDLFRGKVGEEIIKSDQRIRRLAENIAEECCGLPLALITSGRAMSTKQTWNEWQNALTLMRNSQLHKIPGMKDQMLNKLIFSYENLQDAKLKKCFLSCSLWPENFHIPKDELISCWMGLDLIDDYDKINEAYDMGHSIIGNMIGLCLLEPGKNDGCVKMHDVIRDLALWIASEYGENEKQQIVKPGTRQAHCEPRKWEEAYQISLMHNRITSLPEGLPKCQNLVTLMLQGNRQLCKVPSGFFESLLALTYLDMSSTGIDMLPTDIGKVVNLQFLNLSNTAIKSLPMELGNLVKLKYLLLKNTWIESIHSGLISRLLMLQVLDMSCRLHVDEGSISDDQFKELERSNGGLKGLGITVNTVSALQSLSMLSRVSIVALEIKSLEANVHSFELLSPSVLGNMNIGGSIKELRITWWACLEKLTLNHTPALGLPSIESLLRLENLHLQCLARLRTIIWRNVVPAELFASLRNIEISECNKLKNVSWVLQLPCLERMCLSNCRGLEAVIDDEKDGDNAVDVIERTVESLPAFPKLKEMELRGLLNLSSICCVGMGFPSLETLSVYICPMLKKLPFRSQAFPHKLQNIEGWIGWWNNLVWEDDRIGFNLKEFFKDNSGAILSH